MEQQGLRQFVVCVCFYCFWKPLLCRTSNTSIVTVESETNQITIIIIIWEKSQT